MESQLVTISQTRTGPESRPAEPKTEELPLEERQRRVAEHRRAAESRLSALAAAVREHERTVSDRPYAVRHADLRLYRRLRQISGMAA